MSDPGAVRLGLEVRPVAARAVPMPQGRRARRISAEDYAIAFVDELETGAYPRQRLSVAQAIAQTA